MEIVGELKELYSKGEYRAVIERGEEYLLSRPPIETLGSIRLELARAHYQLGEYREAYAHASVVRSQDGIFLSAQCAERLGLLEEAQRLLAGLPVGKRRDNLLLTVLIARQRKDSDSEFNCSLADVFAMISRAMQGSPYEVVDGHILNNVAWMLYEARKEERRLSFLPILPGIAEMAIGIYKATNAAPNHLAAAHYRASLMCEAADLYHLALAHIDQSVSLWDSLYSSQGGERYEQNLENARHQRAHLRSGLT